MFHVRLFVSVGVGTENNDISRERVFESDARDGSGLTHMGARSMWEVYQELSLTAYLRRCRYEEGNDELDLQKHMEEFDDWTVRARCASSTGVPRGHLEL
eukprot:8830073-Pyramimonas_sp.AAC.1